MTMDENSEYVWSLVRLKLEWRLRFVFVTKRRGQRGTESQQQEAHGELETVREGEPDCFIPQVYYRWPLFSEN